MPPNVLPETSRELRLEVIDRGVRNWFKQNATTPVTTPEGESRDVTIIFASGERWVAASDQRGIRDRDGRLILPVISVRRTGIDPINSMSALGANVPKLQISKRVADKTSQLANADYSRPISQRRLGKAPVYDIYTVPFPFSGILNYQVTIQTQYTSHMNAVIEKIISSLEFFDVPSFVIDLEYGIDKLEPLHDGKGPSELLSPEHADYEHRDQLSSYYVVGYFDGDFGAGGNLEEFTDQERVIEMKFAFKVPVVLMLDPAGTRPAVQHQQTSFGLKMGDENVVVVDNLSDLDAIFGPK